MVLDSVYMKFGHAYFYFKKYLKIEIILVHLRGFKEELKTRVKREIYDKNLKITFQNLKLHFI